MQAKTNMPPFVQKMIEEITRDRRKAIVLGVLLVVGIIVGVRAILSGSTPARVSAAVTSVIQTRQEIDKADAAADKSAANRDSRREQYIRQIDRTAGRDLFAMNAELFPVVDPVIVTTAPVATAPATGPDPVEEQRRFIASRAKLLVLQSVISGSTPTVVINDQVLRVGDSIDDFAVMEISENSCLVQRQDVRVALELPRERRVEKEKESPRTKL